MKARNYCLILLLTPTLSFGQQQYMGKSSFNINARSVSDSFKWLFGISADGAVQSALSDNSKTPSTGSLGLVAKYVNPKLENSEILTITAFFATDPSRADTLKAVRDNNGKVLNTYDFYNSMIIPGGASNPLNSFNFSIEMFPCNIHEAKSPLLSWRRLGLMGYFDASSKVWQYQDTSKISKHEKAVIMAYGIDLTYNLITKTKASDANQYGLSLFMGITGRTLGGDIILNDLNSGNNTILYPILNIKPQNAKEVKIPLDSRQATGFEVGCVGYINGIRASGMLIDFDNNLKGLSNVQVLVSFGFSATALVSQ